METLPRPALRAHPARQIKHRTTSCVRASVSIRSRCSLTAPHPSDVFEIGDFKRGRQGLTLRCRLTDDEGSDDIMVRLTSAAEVAPRSRRGGCQTGRDLDLDGDLDLVRRRRRMSLVVKRVNLAGAWSDPTAIG